MRRLLLVLVAAGAVAAASVTPADAIVGIDVEIAKKPGGPHNETGVRINIDKGESKDVYLRISSPADEDRSGFIQQETNDGDYRLRFFKGTTNVTQAVDGAGHEFTVPPGKVRKFRVNVKQLVNTAHPCIVIEAFDAIGPTNLERLVTNNVPVSNCL